MVKTPKCDAKSGAANEFNLINPPPSDNNDAPQAKALPDHDRVLYYGRVLESIFANPTYREVLYETVTKELEKTALGGDKTDFAPDAKNVT